MNFQILNFQILNFQILSFQIPIFLISDFQIPNFQIPNFQFHFYFPNAIVTLSPDHSPKVPLLQDAVGACSSIRGIKPSKALNTGTAALNTAASDTPKLPQAIVTTPEFSPKVPPLQDAVGACSTIRGTTFNKAINVGPAALHTSEPPS